MMDTLQQRTIQKNRSSERGAALVTSLLVVGALLVVGGALVQVTSMSARNTIDSTAESQAYYAAEAGLQAALNALRGNTEPKPTAMPSGMTGMNFCNAVIPGHSNDSPGGTGGDPSTNLNIARLSRWLNYSNSQVAGTRVTVGTNPTIEYDVVVSLLPGGSCANLSQPPTGLRVQSTGYGPNGAVKQMQMVVSKNPFDPTVPAMMTLIGAPGGSPRMDFDSGSSKNHEYSGKDLADPPQTTLPAFAVTNTVDYNTATSSASRNTTSSPAVATISGASIPEYLQSPAAARAFLTSMEQAAIAGQAAGTATYLDHDSGGMPNGFTFVKGDYDMGPGSGSGLLIVTGELTTNGNTNFRGIILVIGEGSVNRNGGGGGLVSGAMFIAQVDWPADNPPKTNFGAPFFNFNGGGVATMRYNSDAVAEALELMPATVLGVSEY